VEKKKNCSLRSRHLCGLGVRRSCPASIVPGVFAALLVAQTAAPPQAAPGVRLRSIPADRATGVSGAVVVEEGALVHTALMFPEDQEGRLAGGMDATAQAARVLANIELALKAARTTLDHLVRLHVYVADSSVTPHIDRWLVDRFGGRKAAPAVTFVETAMPRAGVLVAMDAIAATAWTTAPGAAIRLTVAALPQRTGRASHAAVQPAGPFVIVSGRAARGDFEPAVRETLAQLRGDLETVGVTFDQVVQIKSFLGDMRNAQRLEEIIAGSFGGSSVPPQVVTEWHQDSVPAEIELVATARRASDSRRRVDHVEPIAGRYSRVARVNEGQPVFVSGLYGESADPVAQVGEMFTRLQRVLQQAGSDIRHLVKATYYVSDKAADDRINAIRPTIYDPERPPAASKLSVRGTGRAGRASTFDMIAVTAR
jgi:enamine deaminase RidA (YjgF/YER057c/UK114 family)